MTFKKAFPILAVVLGVVCGVLHGMDLVYGYDSVDLPTGAPWLTMLYVVAAVAAILCVAVSFTYRKTSDRYQAFEAYLTGGGDLHKMAAVLCAALFVLFGLLGLYVTATHLIQLPMFERVTLIPMYLFAMVSGLTLVRLGGGAARGTVSEENAALIFLPIAWAALDLVNTFKANGSVPMEGEFVFELLAAATLLCALHAYARMLFSTPRPRYLACFGGLGVVFGLTGGIGCVMDWLLGGTDDLLMIPRGGCYLACALWFAYQLTRMAACKDEPEGPKLKKGKPVTHEAE